MFAAGLRFIFPAHLDQSPILLSRRHLGIFNRDA
jgi:hypothetical protein